MFFHIICNNAQGSQLTTLPILAILPLLFHSASSKKHLFTHTYKIQFPKDKGSKKVRISLWKNETVAYCGKWLWFGEMSVYTWLFVCVVYVPKS